MPSMILMIQSGGIGLVSGAVFSGSILDLRPGQGGCGGVQIKLAAGAPGIMYVGLPNLSGTVCTFLSGGSLTSGGLQDAFELSAGDAIFIPKYRLYMSGIEGIRMLGAAASSGARVFWDVL